MRIPSLGHVPLVTGPIFLSGVVLLALVLRVWRMGHGLPDFLEEAAPFRLALAMRDVSSGRVDWNPHVFHEPSLSIYLHFLIQQIVFTVGSWFGHYHSWADYLVAFNVDPTAMVLAARTLGIAFDLLGVLAAVRIGRRLWPGAGIVAGLIVAVSPAMIGTARSIHADSIMTCLSLWAIEHALAWHADGAPRRLRSAVVLIGLAAGAQYPAAFLLLPLAWLIWDRESATGRAAVTRRWLEAAAAAGVVFLITTPFAVLDLPAFLRDLSAAGRPDDHLGGTAASFGYYASVLARNLGALGAILWVASPILAASEPPPRRVPVVALWLALLGLGVPVFFASSATERQILSLLAMASLLAAGAMLSCLRPFHRGARVGLAGILAVLTCAPLTVEGLRAAARGSDTTQLQARRWCERYLRSDEILVQEGYSARLPTSHQVHSLRGTDVYRLASPSWRARLDSLPTFRVVALPLGVSGPITTVVRSTQGAIRIVDVLARAEQLNQVFYDPRLFAGADYMMTSSSVRGRYLADPQRFFAQAAFYRLLDNAGERVVTFAPRGTTEGPEIVVYKLGSRYRAAIRARGELDSLWWTNCVPREYRARVTAMMTPRTDRGSRLASAPARPGSAVHSEATTRRVPMLPPPPDTTIDANLAAAVPGTATAVRRGLDPTSVRSEPHQLPAWMKSLSPVYDRRVRMFVDLMTLHLAETGRWDPARQFALATHVVHPEDETAAIFLSIASRRGGRPGAARNALERTLAARPQAAASDPLRIEYARALRESGDPAAARRELVALARAPEGDPIGDEARRLLATRPLTRPR